MDDPRRICVICRYPVEQDDEIAPTPTGRCLCLQCFRRETDDPHVMPKWLREELERFVNLEIQ